MGEAVVVELLVVLLLVVLVREVDQRDGTLGAFVVRLKAVMRVLVATAGGTAVEVGRRLMAECGVDDDE